MKPQRIYDPAIEAIAKTLPCFDFSDASKVRAMFAQMQQMLVEQGIERPTDDSIDEIEYLIPGPEGAPEIPIRLYRPKGQSVPMPIFINFHGGGFMLGDLELDHPRSLVMAAKTNAIGIMVDYRLAPEHPFPAAVEDCYATLEWVAQHADELNIDPNRIVIGGGSAGGNLAAGVALMSRDRKGPKILLQMLLYPALDDRGQTESMKNGEGLYICDSQSVRDVWQHYLGRHCSGDTQAPTSHYAAPARADNLSHLPPAYIVTCEHDALRDEGILYAMRLMNAAVPVELHHYPGTVHGFDFLTPSPLSEQAIDDCVTAFKRACHSTNESDA
ncbi:alpha/beta hydrolase [Shewanella surugensis]|uniref:Alpha/beta hydrolase n=1 Tax=Shewanella surugensis TaxID=212020 RepID=A0ABT0LFM1_9GAMM|nr:alpha/beta hydrolase [Shewanella surugensis]MCL1126270.1 alpha/beta hydrolase [Shewanella surugensis]